jgi:hypothetical protein
MTVSIKSRISFEQAKAKAEAGFSSLFVDGIPKDAGAILSEFYLEAEYCWMFFRNKALIVREEFIMSEAAISVSRMGRVSWIADLSDEPERLKIYIAEMSDYYRQNGE